MALVKIVNDLLTAAAVGRSLRILSGVSRPWGVFCSVSHRCENDFYFFCLCQGFTVL